MPKQIEQITSLFRQAVQYTVPTSVNVLSKTDSKILTISSTWSQNNIERKSKMVSEMFQTINMYTKEVTTHGCADISSNLLTSYSKSSILKAVVREVLATDKTPKKQYVEVWKDNIMFKQFDLQSLDLHGDIYLDNDFGSFDWSENDDKILYIAEKKKPKTESFLNLKKNPDEKDEKIVKGNEYLFRQDWGEQLVGKCQSVLSIIDLSKDEVSLLDIKDENDYFFASGIWAPEGGIFAVAYVVQPRKLGRVFCTNRPSYIVHISPEGILTKLSDEGMSVFGPKVSPDQKKLIWFQREIGGPHHSCVKLIKFDLLSKIKTVIVDYVADMIRCTQGQDFFGLYNETMPPNCWLSDNTTVILSSIQRISVKTFAINTDTGAITEISGSKNEDFSQGVLKVWKDYVICWRSSLQSFPGLYMAKLDPGNIAEVNWIPLVMCEQIKENYSVNILRFEGETWNDPKVSVRNYSAIYFGPKSGEKVPLIVWSHGGPHSAFTNSFDLISHFFCKMNFGILMVNYRGSLGAGRESIYHLLGKIGISDVSDVFQAYDYVIKKFPSIDSDKSLLFGGSHGGFLSLHLAGQFPDSFKSCVVRNPVTDLTQMGSSDIPDWAYIESGLKYSNEARFTPEEYERLWKTSPQYFVDQVKIPVLLLIGSKDLRVPPHHGINYYHALKEYRKAKTQLHLYEDNHSLSQSAHNSDVLINTAIWFSDIL